MSEDIRNIKVMEIKELYPMFALEVQTTENSEEIYKKVRYGIDVDFDIYDYLHNIISIKGKTGKALYRGRSLRLRMIWTELEKRNNLMKEWLIENMEDKTLMSLRI